MACIRGTPAPKLRSFLWFGGQIEYFESMSTELVWKNSSNLSSSLHYDIRLSKDGKFRGFCTSLGDSVTTRPFVGGAVQICRVLAQIIDPRTESQGFTTTTSEGYSRASIDTCERWIYSWRGVGAIMASKGAIL